MRSAKHNLKSPVKRNTLDSTGLAIKTIFTFTTVVGSVSRMAFFTPTKKVVFAVQIVMLARNTVRLARGARNRFDNDNQPSTTNPGVNIMATKVRISLGFQKYSDQQLATLAAAVIKGMTGNKAFPTPPVDLAAAQTALDDYTAALAATIQGGMAATATKNAKRDALTAVLEKLGHYVQTHSNNDRETLISSGFIPLAPRSATSLPDKPVISSVNNGNSTELVVKALRISNARFYELRSAPVDDKGAPGDWQQNGFFSKSQSMLVNGLKPGISYAFQVRAMGIAGFSDWSDPVTHVCW